MFLTVFIYVLCVFFVFLKCFLFVCLFVFLMFQEHLYDPVSHCGFIEMKLRNLRRSLHDDQRRYRKRRRSSEDSAGAVTLQVIAEGEDESMQDWITATKRMRPSPENLASIKMGMEKTFNNRRLWITTQSPTVEEIFHQYPRFVDLPYLVSFQYVVL